MIYELAPMLGYTHPHFLYWMRLTTARVTLYTEMLSEHFLCTEKGRVHLDAHGSIARPLIAQVGGSNPQLLSACARVVAATGYFDAINLNVGCPSKKVQRGRFGACLMKEPEHVVQCVQAMSTVSDLPVTVKCRIGVDQYDDDAFLIHFIDQLVQAGVQTVVVHARKAYLNGLNPKQNRSIPPLNYQRVYRLKSEFPQLSVVLNGGLLSFEQGAIDHGAHADGLMIGRSALKNTWLLADPSAHLSQCMASYVQYMRTLSNVSMHHMMQPLLGLFSGISGIGVWRRSMVHCRTMDELAHVIEQAPCMV